MLRRVQPERKFDFALQVYLGFLGLVVSGIGFAAFSAMQPIRLANPGLAAYEAPAAVRALYPRPRTWLFADQFSVPHVAALDLVEPERTSSTIGQPRKEQPAAVQSTSRPDRKARMAAEQRKIAKRMAARLRERQREAIAASAYDYAWSSGYGFKSMW